MTTSFFCKLNYRTRTGNKLTITMAFKLLKSIRDCNCHKLIIIYNNDQFLRIFLQLQNQLRYKCKDDDCFVGLTANIFIYFFV